MVANTETRLPKLLLTYLETAAVLGVSERTVRQLITDGKPTKLPVGPQIMRVAMAEIEAYIEQLRQEAT